MNRSVLLVICDFLILTLLSFVRFDSVPPGPTAEAPAVSQVSMPAMSNMLATLEGALEAERERRAVLTNALAAKSAELEQRLRLLAERESHLTNIQSQLSESEAETRRLAEERSKLERTQNEALASVQALQRAFEVTQRGTDNLQERLSDSIREAADAKARLEMAQNEINHRREEAMEMQRRIARLDETRDALVTEKQQLMVELRTTEVEAQSARHEVTNLNQQLSTASQEKAELITTASRLATNVGTLTEQSSAIREQIERQTRLPANTIYGDFLSNRVLPP